VYPRASHTVWDVLGWLGAGMTEEDILNEHPDLKKGDFAAVYQYAAETGRKTVWTGQEARPTHNWWFAALIGRSQAGTCQVSRHGLRVILRTSFTLLRTIRDRD